jgi:hypothetical protein
MRTEPSKCERTRAQCCCLTEFDVASASTDLYSCFAWCVKYIYLRGRGRALYRSLCPRWVGVGAHALCTRNTGSATTLVYLSACLSSCPRVITRGTGVYINARSRGSPKRRGGTARNGNAKTIWRAGAQSQHPRQTQNGETFWWGPLSPFWVWRGRSRRSGYTYSGIGCEMWTV